MSPKASKPVRSAGSMCRPGCPGRGIGGLCTGTAAGLTLLLLTLPLTVGGGGGGWAGRGGGGAASWTPMRRGKKKRAGANVSASYTLNLGTGARVTEWMFHRGAVCVGTLLGHGTKLGLSHRHYKSKAQPPTRTAMPVRKLMDPPPTAPCSRAGLHSRLPTHLVRNASVFTRRMV